MSTGSQYFIWAEGVEQGPMSLQQLIKDWRSGTLPKGFLWRRESDQTYQAPDALVDEEKPKTAQPVKPVQPKKIPRFTPPEFSQWLSMAMFAVGFVFAIGGIALGVALMSLSIAIIMSSYAASMLSALNEIVRKLHEIDQTRKGF